MLSIIIPTLNEEKVIETTIKRLRASVNMPFEIIITDGNSTDRTVEIAKMFANKVVEYKSEKRQTIAQGRNDGAKVAVGDYLVFFDADCTVENPDNFYKRALDNFEQNPKLVALTSRMLFDIECATFTDRIITNTLSYIYAFINNILHIGIAWGEFEMVRKDAFFKVNGFQEHLTSGEDGDLFFRLSKIGRTKLDLKLVVRHPGRRAHKIGWPKLLSIWWLNAISLWIRNKSIVKEWKVIR